MDSWFGGSSSIVGQRDSRTGETKYYQTRPSHSHSQSGHHHSSSRRSPSPKRYFVRDHSPSRQSVHSTSTSRGFWSRPSTSSSSYYKRRPRDGYISRLIHQIKSYIRRLMDYARRNPMKLFMLVIMPLVTGGALHGVLRSMGIRLPAGIEKVMGGSSGRDGRHGGGYGGGGGGGGKSGSGIDIGQLASVAKMFM